MLAATATKVSVYVLLRFFFSILGGKFSFEVMDEDRLLLGLALIATVVGSVVAVFQTNLKSMLAYSSIAQIGYMVLGISFISVNGLTAGIIHLFNHALMKAALFMTLGCLLFRVRAVTLEGISGVAKEMPWTMVAFVVGGLSLIGVPLTAGFISKWYLVLAALERGWWPVAGVILLTSLLAVAYIWRVVEVAYFHPRLVPAPGPGIREAPLSMLLPTWVLIVTNIYFGLHTSLTVGVAQRAAQMLLGSES